MPLRLYVDPDGFSRTFEFASILAVARPREGAQPLMRMGLQDGSPRAQHFASFAPEIARRADLAHAALRGRQIWRVRQSSLAGGLSRPIHIENLPPGSLPVPQPTRLLRLLQRSGHQVFEKDHAQRLDRLLVQAGEKARKRRAVR